MRSAEAISSGSGGDGASLPVGIVGAVVLFLYGIVRTYQPEHFGRVYAAYGGVFVVLSMLWGWTVDRIAPIASISSVP